MGADRDPLACRQLGRHVEIQDVAAVIAVEVEDPGAAIDGGNVLLERNAFVQQIEQMALEFATHPEVFERQLDALLEHDVRDQLARLDIPTRVMCGRRDIMVPPELSEELSAAIPGADLKLLDGGHAYNLEEFDAFNKTVLEFLTQH